METAEAAESAEAAARTVLRLLAVGDIETVWLLLHEDCRRAVLEELSPSHEAGVVVGYGPNINQTLAANAARQPLLDSVGGLAWAAAERRVRTVDVTVADDVVVITLEVDGESGWRWDIEMMLTDAGWQWHNVFNYRSTERRLPVQGRPRAPLTGSSRPPLVRR